MEDNTRFYQAKDMARIASAHCEGCGECCRSMGESIRLDPLDVHELTLHLGRSFSDLLETAIGLHAEEGVILPHLLMKQEQNEEACFFLDKNGRCQIHEFRPGLCRLFPLGRDYDGKGFRYFIVEGGCGKTDKSKIKIEQWLGISEIEPYERFVSDWHYFIKETKEKIAHIGDMAKTKKINLKILELFYQTPYDPMRNFYLQFAMRLKRSERTVFNQSAPGSE